MNKTYKWQFPASAFNNYFWLHAIRAATSHHLHIQPMTPSIFNTDLFERKRIRLAAIPPSVFIVLLWIITIVDRSGIIGRNIYSLGIYPLDAAGLWGIIFSPLIHSGYSHLLSNTVPIFVLVWCLFYFYRNIAFATLAMLWLSSGLLTWLIGRSAVHLGASGLVFALFAFLFFSGIFRRYTPLVAVSLMVVFIYGSTVWSIFPFAEYVDASISWEGHLAGFCAGFIFAVVLRHKGPQKPPPEDDDEDDDECNGDSVDYSSDEYL